MKALLIANRGEIAVRIARTAREMGITTIAAFAEADREAFHTLQADRAVSLGDGSPLDTYLSIPRVLEAAQRSGADAVHPGYGFLSEDADFARAVEEAGLVWVGPPASAMEEMGDKLRARRRMEASGVPVVPGSTAGAANDAALAGEAERLGFPLLVKASAGGGGKGMSRVDAMQDLPAALALGRRVAGAAFGDETIYLERCLDSPRHVEFQVFGDVRGNIVHLFERECSVQRRHQKIVEETPCCALDGPLRAAMGKAAVEAARAVEYVGAGTVEFLLDRDGHFYFLEMNTRLQVEHPITEETLGIDLVRAQLEIAGGSSLPEAWMSSAFGPRGHAIQMRLYAEDPIEFLPRSGRVLAYEEPTGPGVRVDSGIGQGSQVGLEYDPLLAKLVVFAENRPAAIARARRALAEWVVLGLETNAPLFPRLLESEEFRSGVYDTGILSRLPAVERVEPPGAVWIAAALAFSGEGKRSDGAGLPDPAGSGDPWAGGSAWRAGV